MPIKHSKEWEDELPESLTDAIYTFYLANAIRDLRGDIRDHRSMLINISRFVRVQQYIKGRVEEIHASAYRALKYNLSFDFNESMKDPVLKTIYKNWEKNYSQTEYSWDDIITTLFVSMEKIQIKVVNSSRNSEKLEYPKNESLRVIAIGGLALSRGLTLEGLIVSYFYRNTCTYDVLMQMGRWFGYRRGYEDLFRIWTHRSSAEWYAEIAEATEELKDDMFKMRELGQKPREFGIRVRNNSTELSITAYNKMRNATDEVEVSSYFGAMVETPYLHFGADAHKKNFKAIKEITEICLENGLRLERQDVPFGKGHYILQDIPKGLIINLLKKLKISKFSSDFDTKQIITFLSDCTDPSIDLFDMAFMDGKSREEGSTVIDFLGRKIYKVIRNTCVIDSDFDRLNIGRRGKLGGTNDGLTGIIDYNGKKAAEIIEAAKQMYQEFYEEKKGQTFTSDKSYPSNTWFRFIEDRKPLLIVYFIDVSVQEGETNQQRQIDLFHKSMGDTPAVGFALGFPRNEQAEGLSVAKFKTNRVYNYYSFERAEILAEGEEE